MPIIARIGRKKFSTRMLFVLIYTALIVGGATMVYPFLLMLATSTTGEPDTREYRIIPRYWFDREALYQRFLQEKYQSMVEYSPVHPTVTARSWNDLELPAVDPVIAEKRVALWQQFVRDLPPEDFATWYIGRRNMPGKVELLWRDFLSETYESPEAASRAMGRSMDAFTEGFAPYERPQARLWPGVQGTEGVRWDEFKAQLDPKYRRPVDGTVLWQTYLKFKYEQVARLNSATGSNFSSFGEISLPVRLPANGLAKDWEAWVRSELGFRFVGITNGSEKYAAFLLSEAKSIKNVNARLGSSYASPQLIAWPPSKPTAAELDSIGTFLRTVPLVTELSVRTPDVRYTHFLAQKFQGDPAQFNAATNSTLADFAGARPPYLEDDAVTFAADASSWRWWALTRNYGEVIDYIAIRGRSLWNTVFLVGTMILAAITVNPLAAYALSRFRLSATNQVLTFLLATMAFPGEVTMIPNFLLLRQFPIWSWAAGLLAGGMVAYSIARSGSGSMRWLAAGVMGLLAGFFAGAYITPWVGRLVGVDLGPISLLNTFPALILPRLANGYSIFLLKGFFDSLPEEVFEAGRIDGASEVRMLWQLAFPMSTPILAVIVLQTFMAVYGSYLWALVVCQDDSMWTLMVHVFQLQQWAPSYVTMAAAVLCSIPTLIVFLCAQGVIMRGVVLPAYK